MSTNRRLTLAVAAALVAAACSSSRAGSPPVAQPSPGSAPPGQPAPPVETSPPGQPLPSPTVPPPGLGPVGSYTDVLKLYRANLSEDFILERIRRDGIVYDLNADQIIQLRSNGVSERVIQAMLDTRNGAPAEVAPAVVAAPRRPPEDRMTIDAPPPDAPVVWEGLARRNSGIVVLKGRWDVGKLTFADGQIRWVDAKDSSKNLLVPWKAVTEQFLTCLKKPGGNECFEWGFRTANGDEYRFRDVAWEQGEDGKVAALHDYFRSRFPSLVDSQRPVNEK